VPHLHLFHSPSPLQQFSTHTVPILQVFFVNSKVSVQRSFSRSPCCEYTLVSSIYPLHCSALALPPPYYSTAFKTYHCILYSHSCYIFQYFWLSIILFSTPFFPEFQRVVLLLKIHSTHKFAYNHVCSCACNCNTHRVSMDYIVRCCLNLPQIIN
jgi:hypothetical protein